MFMAVLDIQIVITSLARHREGAEDRRRPDELGPDLLSHRRDRRHSADRPADARVLPAEAGDRGAIALFTPASIGCAMSTGFAMLIGFRVLQGMAAGVLMPIVFTAVFLLFRPGTEQALATVLAACVAVIAPSMGPIIGGLITENFSWHWLFLINVVPGLMTVVLALSCLPREPMQLKLLRASTSPR